jgi:hypothetical protein
VFPEGGGGGVSFGVGGDGLADLGGSAAAEFGLVFLRIFEELYRMVCIYTMSISLGRNLTVVAVRARSLAPPEERLRSG